MILLSILIPTIPERVIQFTNLYNELMRQKTEFDTFHSTLGSVEICVNSDKRFLDGGLSIGKKRESLVMTAQGKYLCFLDDDESVSPDYLEILMRLCTKDKDVCTFKAFVKMGNFWGLVDMALSQKDNEQLNPDKVTRRPPWHICPVRSEFAKRFQFEDINSAEDFEWMEMVLSLCQTEAKTERIIFQYNHLQLSESDKILEHGYD